MRHFVSVPILDYSGPLWTGGTPQEQGYRVLVLPHLKRPDAKDNEYYVYSNETEYKAIEADSAASAVTASQIESPVKVIHAHCRLPDVMDTKHLQYTGKNSSYMERHGFTGEVTQMEIPVVQELAQEEQLPQATQLPETPPTQENNNITMPPPIAEGQAAPASLN